MSGSDYTQTPNLKLYKPTYDADDEQWGTHLNANADVLDAAMGTTGGVFLPIAGGIMTGAVTLAGVSTAPTAVPGTNTLQLANTAFVAALVASQGGVTSFNTRAGVVTLTLGDVTGVGGAPNASPSFSGTPAAPTAAPGTSTTQIATTAFVGAATANVPAPSVTTPAMDGTAAIGALTTYAKADHVHPTDTTRYAASNPSGFQTAAQVNATAANYLPLVGGVVSGNTSFGSSVWVGATLYVGYGQAGDYFLNIAGTSRVINFQGSSAYALQLNTANGALYYNTNGATCLVLDIGGSLTLNGVTAAFTCAQGYKPGGGAWAATSDLRVKRDVADYGAGLAQLTQLRPVSFQYNGQGGTRDDGRTHYGLIAQEAQPVMPELVHEQPGPETLDQSGDTRLPAQLATDLGPLTLALVNAVRELAERVAALEGLA